MARPKKNTSQNDQNEMIDEDHPFLQIERLMQTDAHKDTGYGFVHGEELSNLSEDKIPTGSPRMDVFIGGGFKPGVSLFYGDYESGKTAQALVWGKNWQDKYGEKGLVIFFDAEGRLTDYKLTQSGIDKSRFGLYRGNVGESIFDTIEKTIKNNPKGYRYFFILDSINAVSRKGELQEKDLNDNAKIAGVAALSSLAFTRLSGPLRYFGHHLYICSQIRSQNISGGKPEAPKPSGGKATGFYADIAAQMKKGWTETFIKDSSGKIIGNKTELKFVKTYNETTGGSIDVPIKYKHIGGVWKEYECLMIAMEWGWFVKKGAGWFEASEIFKKFAKDDGLECVEKLNEKVQGELNLVEFITNTPELVKYIEAKYKVLAL